ncbi:MAG: glutamate 5-kinase [Hyphomicrobiaceae bacterium]|nr:glutamate 5-kinase [Hyphomicrobiaceae bacterium]
MIDTHNIKANIPRLEWTEARRIVIKIGSALLVDCNNGKLKLAWLNSITDEILKLRAQHKDVVVVSSGSIALGRNLIGLPPGPLELDYSQAAAAVGQISLAHAYQDVFHQRGMVAAQILLTLDDTEERRRYLNARCTIEALLDRGVVPIVNENDTVATTEIRYGDNDRLSARVANIIGADCLVLLSDIDGLYTSPSYVGQSSCRIDEVREITPEIEAMAGCSGNTIARGGMVTKLEAAKIALAAGTHMVISSGRVLRPLKVLSEGGPCTWFIAQSDPVTTKKRWISGLLKHAGYIHIDKGAERALLEGRSLLPAGVKRIEGCFDRGDVVVIKSIAGVELGRGLIAYSNIDAKRILGKKSTEIVGILGYNGRSELIHRDDMALMRKSVK